ncbi:MAG: sel1 repeat family protein [Endomicrobia bacterium]|nr:sel1 repeat family protein [Endomicrobiia bacterium]MCL2799603.1 sel1 repeat family protein [Endomicrobiia bacterium]
MINRIIVLFVFALVLFFCDLSFAKKGPVNLNSASDIADLKKDAENNDRGAQYELSMVYAYKQDEKESLKWLMKSAENGFGKAQYVLSKLYFEGSETVKQDFDSGLKWLTKSAESGYARAQYNLGVLYYKGGQSLKKNYSEALKWLSAAKKAKYTGENIETMIIGSKVNIEAENKALKEKEKPSKKNKKKK